ncbi:hypothetical protein AAVH_40962, partial [Aphelenchoides avenae]
DGYWIGNGWHELPALTPVLMGSNLAAMDGLPAYGQTIEIGVPASLGPAMLSPAASSGSPPTPPPSTSQYQETFMESSIRQMWRARSRLPYDRDVMVDAIMDVPFMAGRQRPSTLDGAVGALWKARGGSSPFPYDAVVGDFISSLESAKTTPAAAEEVQMDCCATAVTPPARQASPIRPLSGPDNDTRLAPPERPLADGRPTMSSPASVAASARPLLVKRPP